MTAIKYAVHYEVYIDDELAETIKELAKTEDSAALVRKIMDRTGFSLHMSNCIRKVLVQGTNEFNMKIA